MEQKESFQWSEVLSGFTVHRNREETQMAMLAGMSGHVPFESEMLKEWRTPFLFYRFFIGGAAMSMLICLCSYLYGVGNGMMVGLIPFVIPMTILILVWELNIPHNISLPDAVFMMLLSGTVCFLVIGFLEDMVDAAGEGASAFTLAFLKEVGKLAMICVFLQKKGRGYGINGVLAGAAAGAGIAVFGTAEDLFYVAQYNGQIAGMMTLILVRVLIVLGGDVLWSAAYGGALALAKGRDKLHYRHFGSRLFLICFIGAYLMSVLWDYDITAFFAGFSGSGMAMALYTFLYTYQGKYILLTIAAWALFLFIARKGMVQAAEAADAAGADKRKWEADMCSGFTGQVEIYGQAGLHGGEKYTYDERPLLFGRSASCMVQYPEGAKGISGTHCEIKKRGDGYVLTDQKSTNGTFLKNGRKLAPDVPYELKDGDEFYLASPENSFRVHLSGRQAGFPSGGLEYGKRTNEGCGQENTGKSFYAACGVVLAAMFLGFFTVSNDHGRELDAGQGTYTDSSRGIAGVWSCGQLIDIKKIFLSSFDNVIASLDIGLFKQSYADGITFTQDGMAYLTYEGMAIDYAQFSYSRIDDTTIHLQWNYQSPLELSAGVGAGMIGASYQAGDSTGCDASYQIEDDRLWIDFFGYGLTLYR